MLFMISQSHFVDFIFSYRLMIYNDSSYHLVNQRLKCNQWLRALCTTGTGAVLESRCSLTNSQSTSIHQMYGDKDSSQS